MVTVLRRCHLGGNHGFLTVDCDVIHFDAAFDQEFFGVAVGQPVSEVPTSMFTSGENR